MTSREANAIVKARPGRGQLELVRRERRPPRSGEAQLRVGAAGICGTDLEIFLWPEWLAERMSGRLPVVVGHELSGVVEAVGPGVGNVAVGDRVSVESHVSCGSCGNCAAGMAHVCERLTYVGVEHDGGFAEFATLPAYLLRVVPPSIPIEIAAMLEPFGLAVRAAAGAAGSGEGGLRGGSVLVSGCGPIGLMAAAVARARGARRVIVSEKAPRRLAAARRLAGILGIDRVVDTAHDDVVEVVRTMTARRGVDLWIDLAGSRDALRCGVEALVPGGEARLLGTAFDDVPLRLSAVVMKELRLVAVHGRLLFETWDLAVELLASGQVDLAPLVSRVLPLQAYSSAIELLLEGEALKILLVADPAGA